MAECVWGPGPMSRHPNSILTPAHLSEAKHFESRRQPYSWYKYHLRTQPVLQWPPLLICALLPRLCWAVSCASEYMLKKISQKSDLSKMSDGMLNCVSDAYSRFYVRTHVTKYVKITSRLMTTRLQRMSKSGHQIRDLAVVIFTEVSSASFGPGAKGKNPEKEGAPPAAK